MRKEEEMVMKRMLRKVVTWYLVAAMLVIGITPRVYAGFSPSEVIGVSPAERSGDLQKVRKFLEMKMVGERLRELGLAPGEVQSRLDQLNDQQIHQLALQVDELAVAGDSGLGIIIAIMIIALLVVILVLLLQGRIAIK
jgi:hypothetical protein